MAADAGTLRVVLLGKTGVGKSSTGNTLLGRQAFQVCRGLRSGTERCQWADADMGDFDLQVTDTPGVSDTHRREEEVLREVGKSIAVSCPGPHVVLLLIRCDARFTQEEYQAYVTLKALFGDEVTEFMIIVFVGADSYGDTLEEQRAAVRSTMDQASGQLQEVLTACGHRYFAINNKASQPERQQQAAQLIAMMKDLRGSRGGRYFQNAVSSQVQTLVMPLVQEQTAGGQVSQVQAVRQVNRDIVEERESKSLAQFFTSLLDMMQHQVLPIAKRVVTLAKDVAGVVSAVKDCPLM